MSKKSRSRSTPNPGWFPKGRSGNPGGRPAISRASQGSAFDVLVEKTLTVTDHLGSREITMEEALQQRTYRDAVAGERMAQREVAKWIMKREAWLAKHAPKPSRRTIPWAGFGCRCQNDPMKSAVVVRRARACPSM